MKAHTHAASRMPDDLTAGKQTHSYNITIVILLMCSYRKGSISFKESNTRRESIARRAAMRLGGLRVVTAGGQSAGVDAALYLVGALVDDKCAEEVARVLQWTWNKGVVVDGLDV